MIKGIVFWTSSICLHSASVFEEIGKRCKVVIACRSEEYGTFGSLNMRNVEIYHIYSREDADNLISQTTQFIHVNGALKTYPEIEVFGYALRKLLKNKCFVLCLNMEQYQCWGMKGFLRRLQWFYLFNIGVGRKIKAIGCTGSTSIRAYKKALVSSRRLFDFIYTVPSPSSYLLEEQSLDDVLPKMDDRVRFVYVGQIIERKCIIPLVETFNSLDQKKYSLDIIGGGPLETRLLEVCRGNESIHYWGKVMPGKVRKILPYTDVLLQTSKLEGWGCTVNEALMYGNRVIVSDAVGARALIDHRESLGQIFKSEDWNDFKICVENEIKQGKRREEDRSKIQSWARCIYPESEANYFFKILDFYLNKSPIKPQSPWS